MTDQLFSNVVNTFQGGFAFGAERVLLRRRLQQQETANQVVTQAASDGASFSEIQQLLLSTPGVSNEIKFSTLSSIGTQRATEAQNTFTLQRDQATNAFTAERDQRSDTFTAGQNAADRASRRSISAQDNAGALARTRAQNAPDPLRQAVLSQLLQPGSLGGDQNVNGNQVGAVDAVTGLPDFAAPTGSPLQNLQQGATIERATQEQAQVRQDIVDVNVAQEARIGQARSNLGPGATQQDLLDEFNRLEQAANVSDAIGRIPF